MQLPEGTTCAQCTHVVRCVVLFGVKNTNTTCDFSPSRFQERGGVAKSPDEKPSAAELPAELARAIGQLEGVEAAIEIIEGFEEQLSASAADSIGRLLEQLASAYGAEVRRLKHQSEGKRVP